MNIEKPYDLIGSTCSWCFRCKYVETSIHDDMDGVIHCEICHTGKDRYMSELGRAVRLLDYHNKNNDFDWSEDATNRALAILLRKWEPELPELDDYFHKAFRQVDVIDEPNEYLDMVFYNLLNASNMFWKIDAFIKEEEWQPDVKKEYTLLLATLIKKETSQAKMIKHAEAV